MKSGVPSLARVALFLTGDRGVAAQEFRATVKGQFWTRVRRRCPAPPSRSGTRKPRGGDRHDQPRGELHDPVPPPRQVHADGGNAGFQTYTRKDMQLEVGQTATINAQLAWAP